MADTELAPCPFCGGAVDLERTTGSYEKMHGQREWWGVVCRNTINVGGTCAIQQVPSASKEAAVERWNRRSSSSVSEDPRLSAQERRDRSARLGITDAATKAAAPADAPKDHIGNTDHVGRDLDGMPQPYAGAIVLLETIAECGARPYIGNDPTPMRETCIEFANALRKAGRRAPAEDAREEVQDARRAIFNAYSECLADDNLTVDQIADKLLDAARRASSAPAIPGTGREKTCTCPSGDGSLRWPCPVHPSEAKAGGEA